MYLVTDKTLLSSGSQKRDSFGLEEQLHLINYSSNILMDSGTRVHARKHTSDRREIREASRR
ncbi:hypothetical protein Syun_007679 [Stephania yunnanensis]|uniref:Uncharacterized protein n=1 Tax=Stephania yunnanensis TaxID=152371 RepID=A0AAP0KYX9_9MAGN